MDGVGEARSGPSETVIVVAFLFLTLAAVGVLLWREEARLLDDPAAKAARGEIAGVGEDSLVRADSFLRAIGEVQERTGPEDVVSSLRLSPVRADFTVRDGTGNQRILSVDPAFDVETRDFGESEQPGVRPRALDPAAPERIFTEVRRRTGAKDENLDYLVFSVSSGRPPSWTMFLDDVPLRDKQWEADARGTGVRRLGEPSGAESARSRCLERARSAEEAARCQSL